MARRNTRLPKTFLRRLLIAFRIPIAIAVLIVGVFYYRGRKADRLLRAQLAEYASRGEPVTASDLQPPFVPDALNAASDFIAAGKMNDAHEHAPVSVAASWVELLLPWTPEESAKINAVLAESGPMLDLVRAAERKEGVDWGMSLSGPLMDLLLHYLGNQRGLSCRIGMAALEAHVRGDDEAAVGHVQQLLHLSISIDRMPGGMVPHLVALGCREMTCSLVRQMAQDLVIDNGSGRGATRQQVLALIGGLLNEKPLRDGLRSALWFERARIIDVIDRMIAEPYSLSASTKIERATAPTFAWIFFRAQFLTTARLCAQYMTDETQTAYDAADLPAALANPNHLLENIEQNRLFFDFPLIVAAEFASPNDRWISRNFHIRTDLRATAIMLGLRLYSLDHGGKLPARLDDLVPAYLPVVPADPMVSGGRPLRFIADETDPRIYSVGTNGTDEGGSEVPTKPLQYIDEPPDCWHREDAVFHFFRPVRLKRTAEQEAARIDDGGYRRRGRRSSVAAPPGPETK